MPRKLESIAKMPVPQNTKQVKQFLGLAGYYRKFVPHFSDIARPLSSPEKMKVSTGPQNVTNAFTFSKIIYKKHRS